MFLFFKVSVEFGLSLSSDIFSPPSFNKICEFSFFNKITLSLFDFSNTFYDSI